MKHQVIYVPGLGDRMSYGQNIILNLWKLWGIKTHYFPLGWAVDEKFETKLKKLTDKIDELADKGKVSLVGVSAGASAVLSAYAIKRNINAVVCIAGKINRPEAVGDIIYRINPAFKQSMYELGGSLEKLGTGERRRIMSIYSDNDKTVPPADSRIKGAKMKRMPGIGHISVIFFSIVFGAPTIARFIRSRK